LDAMQSATLPKVGWLGDEGAAYAPKRAPRRKQARLASYARANQPPDTASEAGDRQKRQPEAQANQTSSKGR
jgi:hypothetical protein